MSPQWNVGANLVMVAGQYAHGDENNQVKHIATEGDYIICGVSGEFYACKPEIFNATYESVSDE